MNQTNAFPLSWPNGWPRAKVRQRSNFAPRSIDVATREVMRQLSNLGVGDYNVILSTNLALRNDGFPRSDQKNPVDPGVAVYFKLKGRQIVLACDKWVKVEENLWAIAKHIEALRGQERWGVGNVDQAFSGYAALPAPGETAARSWYSVIGVPHDCSYDAMIIAYRTAAMRCHPDRGGTQAAMAELNTALEQARMHFGR